MLKGLKILGHQLLNDAAFKSTFEGLFNNWLRLYVQKEDQGSLERATEMGIDYSPMEIAVATYVVFMQSRDAWDRHGVIRNLKVMNSTENKF